MSGVMQHLEGFPYALRFKRAGVWARHRRSRDWQPFVSSANYRCSGAFLSHAWILQKQRSQKLQLQSVICLLEVQLPIYKIHVLLSYIFQGQPSVSQLCFVFQSLFLCTENKFSNINVPSELLSPIAPFSPLHLGRRD